MHKSPQDKLTCSEDGGATSLTNAFFSHHVHALRFKCMDENPGYLGGKCCLTGAFDWLSPVILNLPVLFCPWVSKSTWSGDVVISLDGDYEVSKCLRVRDYVFLILVCLDHTCVQKKMLRLNTPGINQINANVYHRYVLLWGSQHIFLLY